MARSSFAGFPEETMKFLRGLARNNNKGWFEKNRARYESSLVEPALEFIAAMEVSVKKVSEHLRCEPKKSGGSLMRIYRDTRFSKDKSPYKTNIGIQFRHVAGKDIHAPGLYVHIAPDTIFIGAGLWHPDGKPLAAIRQRIADDPKTWKKICGAKAFREDLQLEGESLKRPPRGFDPEHPMIEDLKRKDYIAVKNLVASDVTDDDFGATVERVFRSARPFMAYLCEATGIDF